MSRNEQNPTEKIEYKPLYVAADGQIYHLECIKKWIESLGDKLLKYPNNRREITPIELAELNAEDGKELDAVLKAFRDIAEEKLELERYRKLLDEWVPDSDESHLLSLHTVLEEGMQ
jgi:hypothetical protein